ncbi:MAG: hypothetical protein ACRD1D_13270 [Acidimicrobiales bacterium]
MGFLDRAKKLAEQAKGVAEQAREAAEGALQEARARAGSPGEGDSGGGGGGGWQSSSVATDPRMGTAYVPGMLGRAGWREQGLTDPAAVLPIDERDRAGVAHTTRSEIVDEPYGMGRRWTAGEKSVGLLYQLYPEQQAWEPPGGRSPVTGMAGASQATLPDGRSLVFLGGGGTQVVFESRGIDDAARSDLIHVVAGQLG